MTTTQLEAITNSVVPELEIEATFQPHTPEGKDPNMWQVKWIIRFSLNSQSMLIDYYTGIGHLPAYRNGNIHGRAITSLDGYSLLKSIISGTYNRNGRSRAKPSIDDVIYCVISDSDCLDYSGFEEWAENLGYDADSREAERIYQACLSQSLRFKSMIGQAKLNELREAFQDY